MPAHAGIQYAAASRLKHSSLWNTGSPAPVYAKSSTRPQIQGRAGASAEAGDAGGLGCATRSRQAAKRGAQERTRTFTAVKPLAPEASASTNSATWALGRLLRTGRVLVKLAKGLPNILSSARWIA